MKKENFKIIGILILILIIVGATIFFLINKRPKIYPEQGLAAYYKFNEGSDCTVFDSSGNKNQAFLRPDCKANSPGWVALGGKNNFALQFDGKDDFVEIPDSEILDITEKITIEASVKYSADPKTFNGIILAKYSKDFDLPFYLYSNLAASGLKFVVRDDSGKEHSAIFPFSKLSDWQNTWHNIVGTFDGKQLRILINGVEGTPAEFEGKIKISKEGLRIGARGPDDLGFKGIVDEVKIYNL